MYCTSRLPLFAVIAFFAALRLSAIFGDLWFDEVWTLRLLVDVNSSGEIFTRLLSDTNHPLNSLFLYWLQPAADWEYRLLAWFTGTASVWLAALVAGRQFRLLHPDATPAAERSAEVVAALLFGASYILILYSSEARGYAPALCFSLAACYSLMRDPGRSATAWAAVYGVSCVLGLLAHLIVVQIMAGAALWTAIRVMRDEKSWPVRLARFASWHAAPWAFLGLYYWGFVRHLAIGGGPQIRALDVLGQLAANISGLTLGGGIAALALLAGGTVWALVLIARRNAGLAGFYLVAILVTPPIAAALSRFTLIYPRYYLVSAAFGLLLVGYGLTRLWIGGGSKRLACAAVLALFCAGNAAPTAQLLKYGRGEYREALAEIGRRTPTAEIAVSSDFDFRNEMLIGYFAGAAGAGHTVRYIPSADLDRDTAQWIILHRLESTPAPPLELGDTRGRRYRLDRQYPHAPLSGWDWVVYRNIAAIPDKAEGVGTEGR